MNVLIAAEVLLKEGKSVYYKLYCSNTLPSAASLRNGSNGRQVGNGLSMSNIGSLNSGMTHQQALAGAFHCKSALDLLQKRDRMNRFYQQRTSELNQMRAELADKSGKLCVLLDILERNKQAGHSMREHSRVVHFPFVMVKVDSLHSDIKDPNSVITVDQNESDRRRLGMRCNTKLSLVEDMNVIYPISPYYLKREETIKRLKGNLSKEELQVMHHILLKET